MRAPARSCVRSIREFNAGRDPERLALKYRAMRGSAFAFLRGTCHLFYAGLPQSALPDSPLAWACGDLHMENFGSYKGDNRLVYFDINDFDEAALAPCVCDLVRLLASLLAAAAALGMDDVQALRLCGTLLDAYAAALASGKARWVERETAQGVVRELLDSLHSRGRAHFLDRRTERAGGERSIRTDGRKALPANARDRERIAAFMQEFAAMQARPEFYRVIDIARRIAGTGSLGVARYVILVEGKGSPDGNYLLDLKQALPSALAAQVEARQPRWANEAERVVCLQERVQAVPPAFLRAVKIGGRAYVLKALQPSEDRVALESWQGHFHRLEGLMRSLGEILAWAQLRASGREGSATADELIAFALRKKWRAEIVDLARECSERVAREWSEFCGAYDDGAFALG